MIDNLIGKLGPKITMQDIKKVLIEDGASEEMAENICENFWELSIIEQLTLTNKAQELKEKKEALKNDNT